jgi:serine/threonine-protein kinase TTK/MPS1
VNYMSPEAIEAPVGMSRLKIGRASDVWSLGCIFYQMVYGAPPFQAYNVHQKMRIIPDGSWNIPYPEVSVPIIPAHKTKSGQPEKDEGNPVRVPACFIATMQKCLERDPKKRAMIPELLAEEWVNTIPVTRESIAMCDSHSG